MARISSWDLRFLGLAQHVAGWSKDPSTQVGAVIADSHHRIRSLGFNGFARGVKDTAERLNDRDTKYQLVLHAEENALAFAGDAEGCTLYVWPMPPCAHCMSLAIQRGIARVVAPGVIRPRWVDSVSLSFRVAQEARLVVDLADPA